MLTLKTIARSLTSQPSFQWERSLSTAMATTPDWTALNMHCRLVNISFDGNSFKTGPCLILFTVLSIYLSIIHFKTHIVQFHFPFKILSFYYFKVNHSVCTFVIVFASFCQQHQNICDSFLFLFIVKNKLKV